MFKVFWRVKDRKQDRTGLWLWTESYRCYETEAEAIETKSRMEKMSPHLEFKVCQIAPLTFV